MRTIVGLFLVSGLAFGQFVAGAQARPDGTPNNTYGKLANQAPTGITMFVPDCVTTYTERGPVPGVGFSVYLSGWWTVASGYHAHEQSGARRPNPVLSPSNDSFIHVAGADGCTSWLVTFPAIAGYFTFQSKTSPATNLSGANTYLGFSQGVLPNFRQFAYLSDSTVVSNQTRNEATSDQLHSGQVFAFLPQLSYTIYGGLSAYNSETGDVAWMGRGSIPTGGMLDDLAFGGFWAPWINEEHEVGVEVDIYNPNNYADPTFFGKLVANMDQAECYLGQNLQGSPGPIPASFGIQSYWAAQYWVHFVCSPVRIPRGPVGRH